MFALEVPSREGQQPLCCWKSTGAALCPFIISLDITRESVHLKQDYFWVANCKVNLALIPLNRTSNWSDNDTPGGLSLPGHGKVCGQMSLTSCLAQQGQHGHGTGGHQDEQIPSTKGHNAGSGPPWHPQSSVTLLPAPCPWLPASRERA